MNRKDESISVLDLLLVTERKVHIFELSRHLWNPLDRADALAEHLQLEGVSLMKQTIASRFGKVGVIAINSTTAGRSSIRRPDAWPRSDESLPGHRC